MRVFKFGGASVKDANGIRNLVKVLEETGHKNTFLVVLRVIIKGCKIVI